MVAKRSGKQQRERDKVVRTIHMILGRTDPIGTHIKGVAILGLDGIGPTTNPVTCFQYGHINAGLVQLGRGS